MWLYFFFFVKKENEILVWLLWSTPEYVYASRLSRLFSIQSGWLFIGWEWARPSPSKIDLSIYFMHIICWLMIFLLLISLFVFGREMHRDWNVGLNGLSLVTWECCILNTVWFCVFWQLSCLSCLMKQCSQSVLILWWGRTISRMLCRDAINKVTFVSSPLFLYSVHLHLDSRMQKRKAPNRDQPAFSLQVSGKEEGLVDECTVGIHIFSFFGMKTQEDYWSHFEGKCRKTY